MVAANCHFPESPSDGGDCASAVAERKASAAKTRTVNVRVRQWAIFIVALQDGRSVGCEYKQCIVVGYSLETESFWEHELDLRANLTVGHEVGLDHVVVRADLCVHRQLAEVEDLAHATTQRNSPSLAVRVPVHRQDWRA